MNASQSLVTSMEPGPPAPSGTTDHGTDQTGSIQIVMPAPEEAVAEIETVQKITASAEEGGSVSTSSVRSEKISAPASVMSAAVAALTAGAVHEAAAARAEARAEQLITRIREGIRPGMDAEIQKEAAALISLISDIVAQEFNEYFRELEIAAEALLCENPNVILARRLRRGVRRRTSLVMRPLLFLRTGHPAIQVILGLTTNLYLALPIGLAMLTSLVDSMFRIGPSESTYFLVAIAGAIGSIVSILVRIQDFDDQPAEHRSILFFTGFFKPMIGIASALFTLMILKAGLLPIQLPDQEKQLFFFVSLAFVAGFSERLAGDIVATTESRLGESRQPTQS